MNTDSRLRKPPLTLASAVVVLTIGASCGSASAPGAPTDRNVSDIVRFGIWGGNHIGLQVTDKGARVEYDCARGSIDEALSLDSEGRFDVGGKYVRERGGPQPVEAGPWRPARYSGRVDGDTMTLTVILADTKEPLGTFSLTYGRQGFVRQCQ